MQRTMNILSCTDLYTAYCTKISLTSSQISMVSMLPMLIGKELCPLLLFGDQNLDTVANRIILETTISFIKASARLN